ncbi:MAG: pyridoxamine 5'-phosphate oxidase [Candidatus Xenobia bacterium]
MSRKSLSHAVRARTLLELATHGALGTLAEGHPYTSLGTVAAHQGQPVLLLSDLAEHTRNLRADPRASLLVWEEGAVDPLATGRVTLLGRLLQDDSGREDFLARHPEAERYAGFKDFHWFRLVVESARYVGGFGRMSWVSGEEFVSAEPDPLAALAAGIKAHMNDDHEEHMLLMARHFAGVSGQRARLVEVDSLGFTMRVDEAEVGVDFPQLVTTSVEVRQAMVELVRQARGGTKDH